MLTLIYDFHFKKRVYKQIFHLRFPHNILKVQYQISLVDYKKQITKCSNCNTVHIHSIAFCKTGSQTKYQKVNDGMPLNTPYNPTLNTLSNTALNTTLCYDF